MDKYNDSGDEFDLRKYVSYYPCHLTILQSINQAVESISEYDKMIAAKDIRYLIQEARYNNFPARGRIRDFVGKYMSLGSTQAQKYLTVFDKGSDAIKEALKNKEITLTDAVEQIKQAEKSIAYNPEHICDPDDDQPDSIEYFQSETTVSISDETKMELELKWAEIKAIIKKTESPYLVRLLHKMEEYFERIIDA